MERNCFISPVRKKRLHQQGYDKYTDTELYDMRIGLRFAYLMCGLLVLSGLVLNNIFILSAAMLIASFGAIFPTNPFDFVYNYGVRFLFNKPKVPPRSDQGRFACAIATAWLAAVIFLFYNGFYISGVIMGSVLCLLSLIVSLLDICIPSIIYNFIFRNRKNL